MAALQNYLRTLNLFPSDENEDHPDDEQTFRTNLFATRIYLFMVAMCLIVMSLYVGLSYQTILLTVHRPNTSQFDSLPADADCPCTRASIAYSEFTSFQNTFHPICSSDFVTDRWIKALFTGSNATYFYSHDFRTQAGAQFQALAALCRLVKLTTDTSVIKFQMGSITNPTLFSSHVLRSKVEALIDEFQQTAANHFRTQLHLIRQLLTGNQVVSFLQTNKILKYAFDRNQELDISTGDIVYSRSGVLDCACATAIDCKGNSIITNFFGASTQLAVPAYGSILFRLPGFVSGCLPLNAVLLSTLECFYSQDCIDQLLTFFPTTEVFVAMVESSDSRFQADATLQTVVDALMIERWITNTSFENYYHACAPISCTYAASDRQHLLLVMTTLIESLGGLTVILGMIIPSIVRSVRGPRNTQSVPCKSDHLSPNYQSISHQF